MFSGQILTCHESNVKYMNAEKDYIQKNITLIKNIKENAIGEIENIKYEFIKQNTSKLHENHKELNKYLPVIEKCLILEDFDQDTSLIQNRCDFISNDLKQLKSNIDDRIILINKYDFIMNLLNYKLYEIEYNFSKRIKHLKEVKKHLENAEINANTESKIAMKFVENEKKITDCELIHEEQHLSVRQQMLEAQSAYEKSINVLDDSVDVMKKNFDVLLTLIEAHKHRLRGKCNLKNVLEIDQLQEAVEVCNQLSEKGWKVHQNITDFSASHGVTFTDRGLMITDSGREISYSEAAEMKLLDDVRLVDLFRPEAPQKESVPQSKESSSHSSAEKMTSEDVCYLKDCLGVPLTLAIAEIASVQPRDPIHYLGHWLFKYRYNEEMIAKRRNEADELTRAREQLAKEKWNKFLEDEARAAVIDMIVRAEEEAFRRELRRMELEMEAAEEEYGEEEEGVEEMPDMIQN